MRKFAAMLLTALVLSGLFGMAAYASYSGVGLTASGTPSTRVGSISAPVIFSSGGSFGGGGFSSGK